MVDSLISVRWNNIRKEVILPVDFDDFKQSCKDEFGFTDGQLDELKFKYKDSDSKEDNVFIELEDKLDYENILEIGDLNETYIVIYLMQPPMPNPKSPIVSFSNPMYVSGISNQELNFKVEEIKNILIQNNKESIKRIKQMKEELNKSIWEIKAESIDAMYQIKEEIIDKIENVFGSHLKTEQKMKKSEKKIDETNFIPQHSNSMTQESKIIHKDIKCDQCSQILFSGYRYICHICPDYNLCQDCYDERTHEHLFNVAKDSYNMPKVEVKQGFEQSKPSTDKKIINLDKTDGNINNTLDTNNQKHVITRKRDFNNFRSHTRDNQKQYNSFEMNKNSKYNLNNQIDEEAQNSSLNKNKKLNKTQENNLVINNENENEEDDKNNVENDDDIDYESLYEEIDEELNFSNAMSKAEVIALLKKHKGDKKKAFEEYIYLNLDPN